MDSRSWIVDRRPVDQAIVGSSASKYRFRPYLLANIGHECATLEPASIQVGMAMLSVSGPLYI